MSSRTAEEQQLTYARVAGVMQLFVVAVYMAGEYVTSAAVVPGSFAETARNIMASERLYRVGLAGQLIASAATVVLAGASYVLVRPIDAGLALLALLWRTGEAILGGLHALVGFVALRIYRGADSLTAFGPDQRQGLVELLAKVDGASLNVSSIFFGLGSTVFFYLLFTSRYIPRMLAAFGTVASILALAVALAGLIAPDHAPSVQAGLAPILVAEVATGFWLVIAGANIKD